MIRDIEEEIAKERAEHAKKLGELQKKLDNEREKTFDQQIATCLHGMLCTWNHTDGCGWFYEFKDGKDDWSGHAHNNYLMRAQKLIHHCGGDVAKVERMIDDYTFIRKL